MKVIGIERALLNRLDQEPDLEKKAMIWRKLGNCTKGGKIAGRSISSCLNRDGYIEISPAVLFTLFQKP